MEDLVWYACYGSNLYEKRFKLYIRGGRSDLIDKTYPGCTDKTLPVKNKPYLLPYELYFSRSSSIWEDKGVAFIKSQYDRSKVTLSRIYLITRTQFEQVFLQENGLDPRTKSIDLDLEYLNKEGQLNIMNDKWYGRIIYIGNEERYPVLTFTAPWNDDGIEPEPPGEKYIKVIVKGIRECHGLDNDKIFNYLIKTIGIHERINSNKLRSIIEA